jgi:hypothetical protein
MHNPLDPSGKEDVGGFEGADADTQEQDRRSPEGQKRLVAVARDRQVTQVVETGNALEPQRAVAD